MTAQVRLAEALAAAERAARMEQEAAAERAAARASVAERDSLQLAARTAAERERAADQGSGPARPAHGLPPGAAPPGLCGDERWRPGRRAAACTAAGELAAEHVLHQPAPVKHEDCSGPGPKCPCPVRALRRALCPHMPSQICTSAGAAPMQGGGRDSAWTGGSPSPRAHAGEHALSGAPRTPGQAAQRLTSARGGRSVPGPARAERCAAVGHGPPAARQC